MSRDKHPILRTLLSAGLLLVGMIASGADRIATTGRLPLLSERDSIASSIQDSTGRPTKEQIIIDHVDVWSYDKELNPDAQVLRGNVVFKHNDATMYCDSALLYEKSNRFEAYGEVHIEQGDSLHIYCHYLDYDGPTLLARLRYLVRMEHGQNTLYTDSLDYDRGLGIGYYADHGTIVDSLNVLSSVYGEYDTTTKTATFNNNVKLENENFTLYSDTLFYDTNTHIATILGPTRIVGDSGVITATRGTYDTERDVANLLDRAEITSDKYWMTGDSLRYDRPNQFAELHGHVVLRDTAQRVDLRGNYIEYNEGTGHGLAKDSAYIMEYSEPDTLWAHAQELELLKVDSLHSVYKGKGNVRLYRSDIQAVADSLLYLTADSLLHLIGSPYIWSGSSQVTGDSITLYFADSALHHAHIRQNAYLSDQVRDNYFNQLRGREVLTYFSDNKMDSLWARGNAESIYYNLNADSLLTEQIRSQSSAILMQFDNQEIERIMLLDKTVGTITPVPLLTSDQLIYTNFVWFPEGRPLGSLDIFRATPLPGASMSTELKEAAKPQGSLLYEPDPEEKEKEKEKEKPTTEAQPTKKEESNGTDELLQAQEAK